MLRKSTVLLVGGMVCLLSVASCKNPRDNAPPVPSSQPVSAPATVGSSRPATESSQQPVANETKNGYVAKDILCLKLLIAEAYQRKTGKDPRWAKAGLEFLELRCNDFYFTSLKNDKKLSQLGEAALAAGCDDPMFSYWYGEFLRQYSRNAEANVLLQKALKGFQTWQYSADHVCRCAWSIRLFGWDQSEK